MTAKTNLDVSPVAAQLLRQPSLFLIRPQNRAFLTGEAGRPLLGDDKRSWDVILVWLILVPFALLISAIFLPPLQLAVNSATTTGEVVDTFEMNDIDDSVIYSVSYTYEVADESYNATARVAPDAVEAMTPGSALAVYYAPSNPRLSTLTPGFTPESALSSAIMGVAYVVLLGVLINWLRKRGRERRLLADAALLEGRVADASLIEDVGEGGRYTQIDLTAQVTPPNGSATTVYERALVPTLEVPDLRAPAPGTPVAVLYADAQRFKVL